MELTVRELKDLLISRITRLPEEPWPSVRRLDYEHKINGIYKVLKELEEAISGEKNVKD